MERQVFENPPHDEFDPLVLLLLLIIIIALGSLPLLLLANGLIWSVLIWSVAIFVMAIGFWSYNAKKLKFIHIENSGIGLQFKNGKYRKIDWEQVKTIRPLEEDPGKWFLVTMCFPFAYRKEDMEEEKEGLLLLSDGSRYRILWQAAEAIHAGHYEATGRWPI
jgi:hypothetical protein